MNIPKDYLFIKIVYFFHNCNINICKAINKNVCC